MSKKLLLPVVIALLLALAVGVWGYSDVAAQEGVPQPRLRRLPGVLGQVTAIEADQFTIQTRAGRERTFRFAETTRFTDPERQVLSAQDLQAGGWVAVAVARRAGVPALAHLVVILPEDFAPENWAGVRGRVTGVDVPGNSFTIQTRRGESLTFQVTAETRFRSRRGVVSGLEELKAGMAVAVGAKDLGNSQYQALRVLVAPGLAK